MIRVQVQESPMVRLYGLLPDYAPYVELDLDQATKLQTLLSDALGGVYEQLGREGNTAP